jgi:hypothetical protein
MGFANDEKQETGKIKIFGVIFFSLKENDPRLP